MVLVHHKTSSDDNPDGEDSDDSTGRILNAEDLPHLESRSAILEIPPSAVSFFYISLNISKYMKMLLIVATTGCGIYAHRKTNYRRHE